MAQEGNDDGLLIDFDSDSPVLAIAFGGLAMRVGMIPPFEFFNIMSSSAPVKKIFVRDHHQAWYHRGVRGVAADIDGVRDALQRTIDELHPDRVVTLGTSAGGYAALLFGRLLEVSEAHAFSPQTFIDPVLRERYGDRRWAKPLAALMASGRYQSRYGDLAELFEVTPCERTRFVIHHGRGDELGSVHAQRLASRSPHVEARGYDIEDKQVVQYLRARGELELLLRDILVT